MCLLEQAERFAEQVIAQTGGKCVSEQAVDGTDQHYVLVIDTNVGLPMGGITVVLNDGGEEVRGSWGSCEGFTPDIVLV